jgi:hypothetical protein
VVRAGTPRRGQPFSGVAACSTRSAARPYPLCSTSSWPHGGTRIRNRGEGDARSDFDGQFSDWYSGLWPAVTEKLGLTEEASAARSSTEPRLQLSMTDRQTTNPVVVSYRALPSTLLINR